MAWLCVDLSGSEKVFTNRPYRDIDFWNGSYWTGNFSNKPIRLPQDSIKKLIGRELSWKDNPVELK